MIVDNKDFSILAERTEQELESIKHMIQTGKLSVDRCVDAIERSISVMTDMAQKKTFVKGIKADIDSKIAALILTIK